MEFETAVVIDAPAGVVWDAMTDVETYPRWTETMTEVRRLDAGPLAVGSRVRIKQPKLGAHVWTVTEIVPGRSFTWATSAPGARTVASHTVEETDRGTRLVLRIDQRGAIGRLIARPLAKLTQRYIETEAAGCKRWSEDAVRRSA